MPVIRPTCFPGIQVQIVEDVTPAHFLSAVELDLKRIASGNIGGDLLELIAKRSRGIGIQYFATVTVCFTRNFAEASVRTQEAWADTAQRQGRFGVYDTNGFRKPGEGHYMWVGYYPNPPGTTEGDTAYTGARGGLRTPAFIVLAHELIHAWHGISGTMETTETQTIDPPGGRSYELAREEAYTVGLGPYANTRISENAIRAEHRLPRRTYYASPNDYAGFASMPHRSHRPTGQELSSQYVGLQPHWAALKAARAKAAADAATDNWW